MERANLVALINVFENAANHIDQWGWWRPDMGDTAPTNGTRSPLCIGNALLSHVETISISSAAREMLLAHFKLATLEELFEMNDAQPLTTGKEWATSNLREIADNLKASLRDSAEI